MASIARTLSRTSLRPWARRPVAPCARYCRLEFDLRSAAILVSGVERSAYVDDVDLDHLSNALIAPIRTIVDRGGKAWRSYVALACCDVVGGNSQPYIGWLAMPELMHVGSLIVDDVEDRSVVRRGGPAVHALFGEPLAINAARSVTSCRRFFSHSRTSRRLNRCVFTSCISRPRGPHMLVRHSTWQDFSTCCPTSSPAATASRPQRASAPCIG